MEAVSSADLAARVAAREALPDVWVPDSAVRLAQVSHEVQVPFDTVLNSVAATPVVVVSRDAQVDMSTWTAALATPGLVMGDPVRSGVADAPVLAGMIRKFPEIEVTMLFGNLDQIKSTPFGRMIIGITGPEAKIQEALQYLRQQDLKEEVIGYVRRHDSTSD